MIKNMEIKNLAKIIDHTNIKKEAKRKDILKTCQEAKKYGFRGVCVRTKWVKLVAKELKGTGIKTVVLIDPPIGDSPHLERLELCQKAKKDGADELDVVISIPDLKHERWEKILKDLKEICQILPTKVIIGSGYLTDEEILKASRIVKEAGAFCVKTATEKDPLEHRELKEKFYHLKLMRKGAPGLLIKVAGGIRTLKEAIEAIKAGADIIGTSSGVEIIQELKTRELKMRKVKTSMKKVKTSKS
jgi:deoxyribose-phosphate aldolase